MRPLRRGPAWLGLLYLLSTLTTQQGVGAEFEDPLHRLPDFMRDSNGRLSTHYRSFPESLRQEMLQATQDMFRVGYDCYMKCAFPLDELDPIHCKGRGPDHDNPSNININDVLGDYSLTLVDTLDTLAVMRNVTEFQRAVKLVLENVNFDKGNTVQVFEANIRVLGGLLSAHLLMEDADADAADADVSSSPWGGQLAPDWYMGDLLSLAHDLADRLLKAFDTDTGIPHPRVNLVDGVPEDGIKESCTAAAGSLVLELGMLSRLVGDPIYESYARRAVRRVFQNRNNLTGLLGNTMNVNSGQWVNKFSGLGAGMDSFYEYLLKSYVLFADDSDRQMFLELYADVKRHMRRGREHCNAGHGQHPIYVNVDMETGETANHWIDSLQAAFPGVQVLHGDLEEAICQHALYYSIWKRYDCLPERYNWKLHAPDVLFYPLRPEFMESTYLLYRATKNPFYLHVGRDVLSSLNLHTRTECGYATVHSVLDKTLEDRQESFFLSETCKYLYLLFDFDNPVNRRDERYVFTTEGHVFPIRKEFRRKVWEEEQLFMGEPETEVGVGRTGNGSRAAAAAAASSCENPGLHSGYRLPMREHYLEQIFDQFGVGI